MHLENSTTGSMKNQTQKFTQSTSHLRLSTKTPAKSTSTARENAIETAEMTLHHHIQETNHTAPGRHPFKR